MKEIIENLNKILESRIRLGVMSILMVNESTDFNTLKERLNVTDGNLASHITSLEKFGFIKIKKKILRKKMNTAYTTTEKGRREFNRHLSALQQLIKRN